MSLRSQLRADIQVNLNADGDTVVLTAPTETVYTIKGKVTRIEELVDPDTGARFDEPVTCVTVSLLDIGGNEPSAGWKIETTDSEGNALTSYAIDRRFDRTLGWAKFYFEDVS